MLAGTFLPFSVGFSPLIGREQVEDRFGLLAPELIVEGRAGRRLLDRHLGLQVAGRGCRAAVMAGPPFGSPVPGAFPAAGSQALLHNREQICSMK
jgi:hypothetical protein